MCNPNPVNPKSNTSPNPNLTGGTAQERFFAGEFHVELVPLEPFRNSEGTVVGLDGIFKNGGVRVRVR